MGRRRILPLTPAETERLLKAHGFSHKRTRGDHYHWEATIKGQRRLVTVQHVHGVLSVGRMKTMIQQSGLTPEEFYGE